MTAGRALSLVAALMCASATQAEPKADIGEGIYRHGVLGSGAPLVGDRAVGTRLQGATAACVNCHRRSGFGSKEGLSVIPPITGRYLFRPLSKLGNEADVPYVEGMRGDRQPYTEALLARAIREGIDSQGRVLSALMPRFVMTDADTAALIDYLKRLDQRRVPGVGEKVLHFASIVTPDADPVKRRGVLQVLEEFFADRNSRQMVTAPTLRSSSRTSTSRSMFMVHRQWQLHVWELTGKPSTWQAQLERHLAREPVFAVISGLGGTNWAPVHEFCEGAALPCLFPNVEAPPVHERDFYPVYFSRGVQLEADLIASRILERARDMPAGKVVQIYRAGDSSEAGARALAAALAPHHIDVQARVLPADAPVDGVPETLRGSTSADALVLWLRPADIAALGDAASGPQAVFMSGLLGGLERAPLPAGWRSRTLMAYPFDLPERRRVRVDYALGWFRYRHIDLVAEQVQADTYLACGLLAETLSHMTDTFVRDYLLERMEDMIEKRIVTGYYPRLSLASGQRFASKGGTLVRFSEAQGTRLALDRAWFIPAQ